MYKIKIEKRSEVSKCLQILIPLFSIVVSLILMGITIWAITGKFS